MRWEAQAQSFPDRLPQLTLQHSTLFLLKKKCLHIHSAEPPGSPGWPRRAGRSPPAACTAGGSPRHETPALLPPPGDALCEGGGGHGGGGSVEGGSDCGGEYGRQGRRSMAPR